MLKSDSIGKLTEALSKAQKEIKGALRDSSNPFFKASYADLSSVWEACREPLTKNSLAIIQTLDTAEHGVIVETILSHASGEWIGGRLLLNPTKNDPQGMGSAITYGRRYSLAAIVGVCPEDDDGEGAMGRKNMDKPAQKKSYEPPPSPKENTNQGASTEAQVLSESEEKDALPTYQTVIDKIGACHSMPHLKNVWEKYHKLYPDKLSALTALKDKQKKTIEKLYKDCMKTGANCQHALKDGTGSVGCGITMMDCDHQKGKPGNTGPAPV